MKKALGPQQIKALKELGAPGHYRVNWRPNLSPDGYHKLVAEGYIAEAWTWASQTRPDVSITEKGIETLKAIGD